MRRILVFMAGAILVLVLLETGLRLAGFFYRINVNSRTCSLSEKKGQQYIILCLGNSYTKGMGAPPQMSYPAQLQRMLDDRVKDKSFVVINKGVATQNTAELLSDLKFNIAQYHPDLIILQTGQANAWNYLKYNDYLMRIAKDTSLTTSLQYYYRCFLYECRVYRLVVLLYCDIKARVRDCLSFFRDPWGKEGLKSLGFEKEVVAGHTQTINDLDVFIHAVRMHPDKPQNYYEVGTLYARYKNYNKALGWYSKSLRVALASDARDWIIDAALKIRDIRYMDKGPDTARINRQIDRFIHASIRYMPDQFFNLVGLREVDTARWIDSDVREIARIIRQEKIRLIVQNYPRWFPANSILSAIADQLKLPFVHNDAVFQEKRAQGMTEQDLFVPDGHCNARGYGVMADNVFNKIAALGF